jgi:pimeloyl-ACP methyl ester carboxylesterase
VVAVDLAGHGESGRGREFWTIAAFGEDVAAVVEKLGLSRTILVGHSMGGDVILEAARRLPGRVEGLVWVDAYRQLGIPREPEQVRELLAPFRADFVPATRAFVRGMFPPGADPSLVERVTADMSSAPPEIAVAALESAMGYDREVVATVRELGLPLVAVNADDRPTDVESLTRHGVDVVLVPGTGHFPMLEDPGRFNGILRQVIERGSGRASRGRPRAFPGRAGGSMA